MLWLVWLFACDDNAESVGGFGVKPYPNNGGGGGAVVGDTWPDVRTVFENNCYTCHGAGSSIGDLDLETDGCNAIVGAPASGYAQDLVTPGDHTQSVLWHKVSDDGTAGTVMPPSGKMQAANVDTIAAWIDAGASCEENTGGTPTFGIADVQKVFDTRCTSGCHEPAGMAEELDLTDAYAVLLNGDVGVPSRYPGAGNLVDRGHPETSFLMRKIIGYPFRDDSFGERMPLAVSPNEYQKLPTAEIAVVFGWILDGAQDK